MSTHQPGVNNFTELGDTPNSYSTFGGNATLVKINETGLEFGAASGNPSDGDKGDITVSGSGLVWTIDNDVVTNAKIANMATKTYKGRTSGGTGDPEDVAVATLKTDLVLVKADVGLGNVDNTSDANKPVSTATQTALDLKVNTTSALSGTYTPTRSAEVNMDSNVTMTEAQYMRVSNTVTVSGRFTADPTLAATSTSFEITLPVASNIGALEDVAGTAFCSTVAGMGCGIFGVIANDTAKFQWVSSDINSHTWNYIFSYQII